MSSFQLDLIFPKTVDERSSLRDVPNDYARSSLFSLRNKREPRRTLMHEKLFHYNEHVSLRYTGIELRAEDDELIWLQILKYGQSVPFGEPFEFSINDLVADIGWHRNGHDYEKARECISRLKANEILARSSKAYGKSGSMSLIQKYETTNDEGGKPNRFRVWIDPNVIALFAGNTSTSHSWETYVRLSPVARRLADYIESQRHAYPLSVEKFKKICGSTNTSSTSWRQTVRKACAELEDFGISKVAFLGDDDQSCCGSN